MTKSQFIRAANYFLAIFVDFQERKVNHRSFFYGMFCGVIMGFIPLLLIPSIWTLIIGAFVSGIMARLIFLKIDKQEKKKSSEIEDDDYYQY